MEGNVLNLGPLGAVKGHRRSLKIVGRLRSLLNPPVVAFLFLLFRPLTVLKVNSAHVARFHRTISDLLHETCCFL